MSSYYNIYSFLCNDAKINRKLEKYRLVLVWVIKYSRKTLTLNFSKSNQMLLLINNYDNFISGITKILLPFLDFHFYYFHSNTYYINKLIHSYFHFYSPTVLFKVFKSLQR